jgi:hypothetical protein
MIYNLYQVNSDMSKTLLQDYSDLASAQAAMTDSSVTYSIEGWDGASATVLL